MPTLPLTLVTLAAIVSADHRGARAVLDHPETARGVVYHDRDGDGVRDPEEPGLPGVRVSNGRDIVRTDGEGRWAIEVDHDDIVFVIKPRGWMTRLDEHGISRGYYVHKPAGSPTWLEYPGVAPTGDLPDSVDFGLTPNDEPAEFDMVVFGDPQPRDLKEVDYCAHDVFDRMNTGDARLGIALGDIAFDDLDTLEPLNEAVGRLGLPFFYVYGNHDMNFHVDDDELADETWERVYGPTNYSFDYGAVHFVVLDNVLYQPSDKIDENGRRGPGGYTGHFDAEALTFLEVDLAEVPQDQPVVVCFHIHLDDRNMNVDEFLARLAGHEHVFSMSAHTHVHRYLWFGENEGQVAGREPHLHLNHGTVCGSWFCGAPGENGVPHTMMRDGTPNGWGMLHLASDGSWSHRYYGAGMPADEQMRITAPAEVVSSSSGEAEVVVNLFNGNERSTVELRFASSPGGTWSTMTRVDRPDPAYTTMVTADQELKHALAEQDRPLPWRSLPRAQNSTHLWAAALPDGLPPGTHRIEVRAVDLFGFTHYGARTIRILRDPVVETSASRSGG